MNRSSLRVVIGIASIAVIGCARKEPDFTGIDPNILQFHILADNTTDQVMINAATSQQIVEEVKGNPWSDEVRISTDAPNPAGRWMEVSDRAYADHKSSPRLIFREKPTSDEKHPAIKQVLVVISPNDINRHDMAVVRPGIDQIGKYCVDFEMTGKGAKKFAQLTGENLPDPAGDRRQLGIFVDGILMSAPSIISTISDRGQITGDFSRREVEDLVAFLSVVKIDKADEKNATP